MKHISMKNRTDKRAVKYYDVVSGPQSLFGNLEMAEFTAEKFTDYRRMLGKKFGNVTRSSIPLLNFHFWPTFYLH